MAISGPAKLRATSPGLVSGKRLCVVKPRHQSEAADEFRAFKRSRNKGSHKLERLHARPLRPHAHVALVGEMHAIRSPMSVYSQACRSSRNPGESQRREVEIEHISVAMHDAWSIVDSAHRFRALVTTRPGFIRPGSVCWKMERERWSTCVTSSSIKKNRISWKP